MAAVAISLQISKRKFIVLKTTPILRLTSRSASLDDNTPAETTTKRLSPNTDSFLEGSQSLTDVTEINKTVGNQAIAYSE